MSRFFRGIIFRFGALCNENENFPLYGIRFMQDDVVSDLVQRVIDQVGLEGETSDYIIIVTADEGGFFIIKLMP